MRQILRSMVKTMEHNWTSDPRLPCFIMSANILPIKNGNSKNKIKIQSVTSKVSDKQMETLEAVQLNAQVQVGFRIWY
jgi:hypothetical protein